MGKNMIFYTKMRCNFTLLYFFAIYMLSDHRALCDYVVEVNLRSYNNPESRAAGNNGECCDPAAETSDLSNDDSCTEDEICDNFFSFCLRPFSTPPTETRGCITPAIFTTSIAVNDDSLDFTSTAPTDMITLTVNQLWQNGTQLYIGVVDKDQGNDLDDLVDIITVQLRSFLLNSAGLTLTSVSGNHNYGKMSLTVRVYCATFYHGDQCQFVDVCERDSITCSESGVCVKMMNNYTCVCNGGFMGDNCELIDYCFEQSCTGNGTCTNEESSYICHCNPGYTGIDCGINIDDCKDKNCSDNGRCIDELNSYHCECSPGFSGTNCETDIDECDGQNCSDNGLCMDGINSYVCVCVAGYTGVNCNINVDDCEFQICSRSGECVDGLNSYTCVCNTGFTGMNCETNIDDCVNQDCNGLGTCIDGINSFSCNCDPPFTGTLCERIDYCYGVNCNRNGRCVNGLTNFTCDCNLGFTGELCSRDMQSKGFGDGVVIEALVVGVTAALILLVLVIIMLLVVIACLVRKKKSIIATYFPNGEMHGDSQAYGIPNNSLEQTTPTKLTNTGTMRSDMADHEIENTLYTSVQSAEINNPDYGGIDLTRISQCKNMSQ